jgi:hypothetical protein
MSLDLKKKRGPSQQQLNRLANRILLEQELEPLKWKAITYFQSQQRIAGKLRQPALLPTEDLKGLSDEQVEFVLKHLGWFRTQIEQIEEDNINYE